MFLHGLLSNMSGYAGCHHPVHKCIDLLVCLFMLSCKIAVAALQWPRQAVVLLDMPLMS